MTRTSIGRLAGALSLVLTALCVPALASRFTKIEVPESKDTFALGFNPQGDIVGWYYDASFTAHGFLLSKGVFTTTDVPGANVTNLFDINPSGDIVGAFGTDGSLTNGVLLSSTLSNHAA